MPSSHHDAWIVDETPEPAGTVVSPASSVILSFDIEEHDRIEAAAHLKVDDALVAIYRRRMVDSTAWILDQLADHGIHATFFIVGEIARHSPHLVRRIHEAGHEVASHSWAHRRIHRLTPEEFRADTKKSKDILEQIIGAHIIGYRAPTFSITRGTAWAIDILAELGFQYDSSIYPVRHDRYGIPEAPRGPFWVRTSQHAILELPPASLRLVGMNVPIGGGGYFRLLPWPWMSKALDHSRRDPDSGQCVTLYFHPWEFDPDQPRLPLSPPSRFRTYVGLRHTRRRLMLLFSNMPSRRAQDILCQFMQDPRAIPTFDLPS